MSDPAAQIESPFVHLHVHSHYSLLEGAIQIDDLLEKVKELGQSAVALTDKHVLFGAIEFYLAAKAAGIKPIIGCEIFYTPDGRTAMPANGPKAFHLVLLCKNVEGYRNLSKLITDSFIATRDLGKLPASQQRAIVDRDLLDKYADGLIAITGGIKGEIPYRLLTGDESGAESAVQWFKKRFKDDFYFELQDTGLPEQQTINETLHAWGQKWGVECVGTSDCHYLNPSDAEAHEVLQCIEQGRNLDFERPKSLVPSEFYLKSSELMRTRLAAFPGAYENAAKIAAKCDVQFKLKDDKGRPIYHLPNYRPDGVSKADAFDAIKYFWESSKKGLDERFAQPSFASKQHLRKVYDERLASELAMIEKTGFAGYFLIVADFIQWAKRNGIPVGPGRGSGAGSIVAYSLKITDIDPIEFNLLFERFINPERISMPDFDVDFCQERRGEVIQYVVQKYGKDNVSQIITFGKLQARAALKDVARVMGLSFAESDAITKLVPEDLKITVQRAIDEEPRLREKMELEPRVRKVVEYALKLEGLNRNAGVHAAGVIITEEPIVTYCPLYVGKDGDAVVQLDKDYSEKIGLVKFDFLGLKTLTVIDNAVRFIRAAAEPGSFEADFDITLINLSDPKVFELVSSGDTDGVFQVESSGMKSLCQRIQPGSLEDLTAINALYRPGPLGSGMVDDFIDRKHGRKPIVYDVELLAPILKDTYGVILYQEQVMQIARELSGYSLGQADILRRAMGKKKAEEMAQQRAGFVSGAVSKGQSGPKAEQIFDLIAKFAEYGFNKSHSAAYGLITYQTAYLKTHFPAEFMAALMTTEVNDTDKITKYIADARAHDIPVLPPDVNASQRQFSVEIIERDGVPTKAIRFGLEAIKGVGGAAVDAIIEARAEKRTIHGEPDPTDLRASGGPFTGFLDFCRRVALRKVNKKVLESLVLAGAFEKIAEVNRASLSASIENILESVSGFQEEQELGQNSLFDAFKGDELKVLSPQTNLFRTEEDWPISRKLALEKQVVGFFMSGHPLDSWQRICEDWLGWSTARIKEVNAQKAAAGETKPAPPPQNSGGDGRGGAGGGGWQRRDQKAKTEVRLVGILTETREIMTKKGSRMAFAQFEDLYGKLELVFFPEPYGECSEIMKSSMATAEPVILTGDVEWGEEMPKILARNVELASEANKRRMQQIIVKLDPAAISAEQLRSLKKSLLEHRGKYPVRIDFVGAEYKARLDLPKSIRASGTPQMVDALNEIFGRSVVALQ